MPGGGIVTRRTMLKILKIALSIAVMIFSCCACIVYLWVSMLPFDDFTVYATAVSYRATSRAATLTALESPSLHATVAATSPDIPNFAIRFDQLLENVLLQEGALLEGLRSVPHVPAFDPECIRMGVALTYGIDYAYKDVVTYYSHRIEQQGGEYNSTCSSSLEECYSFDHGRLELRQLEIPEDDERGWQDYKTVYSVSIFYGEPRLCFNYREHPTANRSIEAELGRR